MKNKKTASNDVETFKNKTSQLHKKYFKNKLNR